MFIATLVGIFKFEELPEKYRSFVDFKASIENKTIKEDDKIAILNITGTESHHVLFINSYETMEDIEKELKEADAKLNYSSKKILEDYITTA